MTVFINRLIDEDDGQDLIEYALLTAAVGLAAVAVFGLINNAVRNTGGSWTTQIDAIAEPAPPGAGS